MTFDGSRLDELVHQCTDIAFNSCDEAYRCSATGPIEKLIEKARLTFVQSSRSNRFDSDWKKFCALTLMQAGPNYYSILQNNAPAPTTDATRRFMASSAPRMKIGVLDFDGLASHVKVSKLIRVFRCKFWLTKL